jgi:hypothetical protein
VATYGDQPGRVNELSQTTDDGARKEKEGLRQAQACPCKQEKMLW